MWLFGTTWSRNFHFFNRPLINCLTNQRTLVTHLWSGMLLHRLVQKREYLCYKPTIIKKVQCIAKALINNENDLSFSKAETFEIVSTQIISWAPKIHSVLSINILSYAFEKKTKLRIKLLSYKVGKNEFYLLWIIFAENCNLHNLDFCQLVWR